MAHLLIICSMRESIFRFKQFSVRNEKSAMKVGTDGVLLGAWCKVDDCHNVLDIGTGTGLISLMIAQRAPAASIDAVEIDSDAYVEANNNFAESPWHDRLNAICGDFNEYAATCKKKYNLIVSNPPFFMNGIVPPDDSRKKARHCYSLTFDGLLAGSTGLLDDYGSLCMISPFDCTDMIEQIAHRCRLFVKKMTTVRPKPNVQPKRILWELTKSYEGNTEQDELIIEVGERHCYSDEYVALTRNFYLKM